MITFSLSIRHIQIKIIKFHLKYITYKHIFINFFTEKTNKFHKLYMHKRADI